MGVLEGTSTHRVMLWGSGELIIKLVAARGVGLRPRWRRDGGDEGLCLGVEASPVRASEQRARAKDKRMWEGAEAGAMPGSARASAQRREGKASPR